ncbi:Serine/threonine-protein phosphatase PP2A catalytic subunit [Gossypium arboreum]|uniref:Serine/threonine-protein phosphatase PP2A catalytic subunit n=1 Tax=Gossypium arboreum TaxID=29729 RepID=A0A0B0ME59_GOSAR|nr:Serine/threonine-protein phosphatase PP2A catalytic subunit [Gossypium arboreum]
MQCKPLSEQQLLCICS